MQGITNTRFSDQVVPFVPLTKVTFSSLYLKDFAFKKYALCILKNLCQEQ